jgi:hypothetical protein
LAAREQVAALAAQRTAQLPSSCLSPRGQSRSHADTLARWSASASARHALRAAPAPHHADLHPAHALVSAAQRSRQATSHASLQTDARHASSPHRLQAGSQSRRAHSSALACAQQRSHCASQSARATSPALFAMRRHSS